MVATVSTSAAGGFFERDLQYSGFLTQGGEQMGFMDKLLGRGKKAAGDVTGDSSMHREGMHQEQQGMAEDRAASAEEMAQSERERAAEHEAERES
jgi:uncharacterized protein YjbJ (UPF0337 family)